jgi:uncharacterized protein YoaH (UPF0181 family)
VAADAVELAVRQHAQQPRLQVERHVADLVEEQRAAVGLLEAAAARGLRAGEGAALVAEELAFEQVLRDRRGVDGDERTAARGLCLCSARATSSLPVPLSPVISTVTLLWLSRRWRGTRPASPAPGRASRASAAARRSRTSSRRLSSTARRISSTALVTSKGLGRYSKAPPWKAETALSRSE